ncbi:hypothetical protein C2759_10305 [Polynucleobacter sp. MG-Unter2-18]|uniref:hypothetical protein n=1 Tax=Polynucleobacter sp. MG-Unter2-18 TaxID=2081052 RepID=UPI001BFD3963|nr:hypothetical protein [Polynucleobacter sp. MG-Unter2-18]QWD94541.1 hypothetical protein C2759_10305 [Polynucleobacter sp. MG-Unter2-18]
MQLKVIDIFLAKTVLDDDVIGLTPLKVGQYPIRAIEDEQYEVAKSSVTVCHLTSHELEQIIKSKAAVIINE